MSLFEVQNFVALLLTGLLGRVGNLLVMVVAAKWKFLLGVEERILKWSLWTVAVQQQLENHDLKQEHHQLSASLLSMSWSLLPSSSSLKMTVVVNLCCRRNLSLNYFPMPDGGAASGAVVQGTCPFTVSIRSASTDATRTSLLLVNNHPHTVLLSAVLS